MFSMGLKLGDSGGVGYQLTLLRLKIPQYNLTNALDHCHGIDDGSH